MTLANVNGDITDTKVRLKEEQANRAQLRRDLVEILEDSKTDLSRVLIMDRMGSFITAGGDVSKYVAEVKKVDEQINKIQKSIISDSIVVEVLTTNRAIKEAGGYSNYGIIMLEGSQTYGYNGITLLDQPKFKFSKFNKEELDRFYGMLDQLKEEALEIGKKIISLRTKYVDGWKKCLETLAQQEFVLDKDAIRYRWKSSTKYDHIDVLEVFYDQTKVSEQTINLLAEIEDWDVHWENTTKRLIDSVYKNCIKERKTEIQTQIKEICNSFGFEETKFVLLKDTTKPYSFEGKSYVSAAIDLSKPDVYASFRRDLRNAIATIIYMTEKCQDKPGKININVGNNYMFRFIGEKELNCNTYSVYESKIGKKKALLQVFKNGQRLWGRGRVRALRLLNISRDGKPAQDILKG